MTKKIDFALAVLVLLLSLLSSTMLTERRVKADDFIIEGDLACSTITGCCGSATCGGPGSVNGCTLTCAGGGTITCAKVVNGTCQ